jgi:hypothetical protein
MTTRRPLGSVARNTPVFCAALSVARALLSAAAVQHQSAIRAANDTRRGRRR